MSTTEIDKNGETVVTLNMAQSLLKSMGLHVSYLLAGWRKGKNSSHTRKGPGRKHKQG